MTRLDPGDGAVLSSPDPEVAPTLDRALGRLGMPPSVAGVVAATPSLRVPWLAGAAAISLIAALGGSSPRQTLLFLIIAPVVPVIGVAAVYGPWADPMHDLQRSTPISGLHVLLCRTLAVLAISVAFLAIAAVALPGSTGAAWAWVVPAVALSLASLAVSTVTSLPVAAAIVTGAWCVTVAVATIANGPAALFRGPGQLGFLVLAVVSSLVVARRHERFEMEDLRARRAVVDAADAERRRIERNIHDGAQQQLVAMGVKAALARSFVEKDPQRAAILLDQLRSDAKEALDGLREMTRGGRPPVLADEGLEAAIALKAKTSPVPVTLDVTDVGRLPEPIEVAVYFCCLEAMQNAAKYARAGSLLVAVRRTGGTVTLSVCDDGVGFDPAIARRGVGMQSMSERVESLGGTFDVRSSIGRGTVVSARLPLSGP